MTRTKHLRTPDEVRAELARKGVPVAAWARANGLPIRPVYDVLTGRNKGKSGMAHRAAVLLGIKEGEVEAGAA